MSEVDKSDLERLYTKLEEQQKEVHDLSAKFDVFMATQTIKNDSMGKTVDSLKNSYSELSTSFKKINNWIMAGGIVAVILAAIGKAAVFVYDNAGAIKDILIHGK